MARRKKGLTERHKKILQVLEKFGDKHGYPPSIREIGAKTNITSTSVVNYYLEQLEEMGHIERDRKVSRGVRLIKTASGDIIDQVKQAAEAVQEKVEELLHIPVVGRIVASEPVPVPSSDFNYFDAESMVDVARSLVPTRDVKDLFALEVEGDSMIDAMVNDGDIVVMKRATDAHNGEMVAVWLGDQDETTLKYFYREQGRVRLQPANPTMKPIIIEKDRLPHLKVRGKVMMVIRQVDTKPN